MSPNAKETVDNNRQNENGIKTGKAKHKSLPEKEFILRNSLLTDLFENNTHIKTIHHIFVATLICFLVNTVANDYFKNGEIKIGFHTIYLAFGKLYVAIIYWIASLLMVFASFLSFKVWAGVRATFSPKDPIVKTWDALWMLSLIGYYLSSFWISSVIVSSFELPIATAAIILLEQTRFLMKTHAFVRSKTGYVLAFKQKNDVKFELPEFPKFLYFLFAPTLVYKDEYPRTQTIRWKFVMYRALEVFGVIFYYSFLVEKHLIQVFQDYGVRKFTSKEIALAFFENTVPGMLFMLTTFYLVLHSVQNLFAELLRFGDRQFYKDWWTCTNFGEYFRTWNIVVSDWLYVYVYKDVHEHVVPRNKTVAKLTVFVVSALVHEWIVTYMLGFFFPALFLYFFFGGALLSFIKLPKTTFLNILFWYAMAIGSGSLLGLYTLEFYARLNVPVAEDGWRERILPRWLTCDCIS